MESGLSLPKLDQSWTVSHIWFDIFQWPYAPRSMFFVFFSMTPTTKLKPLGVIFKARLDDHQIPITGSNHNWIKCNKGHEKKTKHGKILCVEMGWRRPHTSPALKKPSFFLNMSLQSTVFLETLKLQPVAWLTVVLINNERSISFCDGSCAGFPSVFLRDVACSSLRLHQNAACVRCMTLDLGVCLLWTVVDWD